MHKLDDEIQRLNITVVPASWAKRVDDWHGGGSLICPICRRKLSAGSLKWALRA